MNVVRTSKGVVAVTRHGDRLSIHVAEAEGGPWRGIRSRSPGDSRDALLRALGPQVCARLELTQ